MEGGYDFVYYGANEHGVNHFVFVAKDSMIASAYGTKYVIKGDFSEILAEMEKEYTEAKQAEAEAAAEDTEAADAAVAAAN